MDMKYYEVQANSDPDEGRGRAVVIGNYHHLTDAVVFSKNRLDGEVYLVEITLNNDDTVSVERSRVYGRQYGLDPQPKQGFIKVDDALYTEYRKLKFIFES